jgi:hypothetical protein
MQSLNELKIIVSDTTPESSHYSHYLDSWENAIKTRKAKQDFIWIHYSASRDTSRWQDMPRTRPFLVEYVSAKNVGWKRLGAYKTLDSAILSATKYVKGA